MGKVIGKGGTVRGLNIKQRNGYIVERPFQLVSNIEIGGEVPDWTPNPGAAVFVPRARPKRMTKQTAVERFKMIRELYVEDV